MPKITNDDLSHRFASWPPTPDKARQHAAIRSLLYGVSAQLVELLPASRETSLAITHLEEVMFWANAALARPPSET